MVNAAAVGVVGFVDNQRILMKIIMSVMVLVVVVAILMMAINR